MTCLFFLTSIGLAARGLHHAGSEQRQPEGVSSRRMPEAGAAVEAGVYTLAVPHLCTPYIRALFGSCRVSATDRLQRVWQDCLW